MQQQVTSLRKQFQSELGQVQHSKEVEQLKVKYLGKKGPIQDLMQHLRNTPQEMRPLIGQQINELKEEISQLCEQALLSFSQIETAKRLGEEKIDVTMPGRRRYLGKKHPINLVQGEVIQILIGMGFSVQYGPDIDTDYYNYEGLNFPPDHPARDMQDTFYITKEMLLRSHTSNTQLRVMESTSPPFGSSLPAPSTAMRRSAAAPMFFFIKSKGSTSIKMSPLPTSSAQWKSS